MRKMFDKIFVFYQANFVSISHLCLCVTHSHLYALRAAIEFVDIVHAYNSLLMRFLLMFAEYIDGLRWNYHRIYCCWDDGIVNMMRQYVTRVRGVVVNNSIASIQLDFPYFALAKWPSGPFGHCTIWFHERHWSRKFVCAWKRDVPTYPNTIRRQRSVCVCVVSKCQRCYHEWGIIIIKQVAKCVCAGARVYDFVEEDSNETFEMLINYELLRFDRHK